MLREPETGGLVSNVVGIRPVFLQVVMRKGDSLPFGACRNLRCQVALWCQGCLSVVKGESAPGVN